MDGTHHMMCYVHSSIHRKIITVIPYMYVNTQNMQNEHCVWKEWLNKESKNLVK